MQGLLPLSIPELEHFANNSKEEAQNLLLTSILLEKFLVENFNSKSSQIMAVQYYSAKTESHSVICSNMDRIEEIYVT